MCGRFTLWSSPKVIAEVFRLEEPPPLPAHFNIAPVVRQQPSHHRENHDFSHRYSFHFESAAHFFTSTLMVFEVIEPPHIFVPSIFPFPSKPVSSYSPVIA